MGKATQIREEGNEVIQLVKYILGGIGWTVLFLGRSIPDPLFNFLCRIRRISQLKTFSFRSFR